MSLPGSVRQSVALSFATQHAITRKLGGWMAVTMLPVGLFWIICYGTKREAAFFFVAIFLICFVIFNELTYGAYRLKAANYAFNWA